MNAIKEQKFESMKQLELLRFITTMPIEGSWSIWLLLAVQYFDAGPWSKSFIAGSIFWGLLISPFMLTLLSRFQVRISKAISFLYAVGAVGMLVIAFSDSLTTLVIGVGLSSILPTTTPPLIAALWEQNSPAKSRGLFFSQMFRYGLAAKIIIGLLISYWLGTDVSHFRPVPILFAVLYIVASYSTSKIESEKLTKTVLNPLNRLSLIWSDKMFGLILFAWMLLGISNLSTFPLRTDYIASGASFEAYEPWLVIILIDVLPTIFRFSSAVLWGKLFDKANFILLRIGLNLIFGFSTLFFFTPLLLLQFIGAASQGFGQGGGSVAWNLWVTKYAPPEKTADYMAVHTFLTGIRGVLCPMLAFWAVEYITFSDFAYAAASLAFISVLILAPLVKFGNRNN
ncbi:MAG: MFS transporter [Bdellovibrionota bacterium]